MRLFLPLLMIFALTGCIRTTPFVYAPSGTFTGSGKLQVVGFRYQSEATSKPLRENQMNGWLPTTRLDRPVAEIVTEGLRAEVKRAGLAQTGQLALQGTILGAEMDRLALPAKAMLTIQYELTYKGKPLYGTIVTSEGQALYYGESLDALNGAIASSFDKLMANPKVQKVIAFYSQ